MRFSWWLLGAVLLYAAPSFAFPWMVRHEYQSCGVCHVDPSGGGQLSMYGRAQSDTLLRWKLKKPKEGEETEVPKSVNFLWFLEMPEFLNLSGNLRGGALIPIGGTVRPVFMASDLYATAKVDRFVGHVTTGVGVRNAGPAAILPLCDTQPCGVQWIAREYWLQALFLDDALSIRAGRMNLPFGLRNNEHFMWVRDVTNTDINLDQQVGASVSYNGDRLRGEVMGIAGNFSLGPDAYRERGYSLFAEYAVLPKLFVGVSSLITLAQADISNNDPVTRHAHGIMARWSPGEVLALMAEANFLAWLQPTSTRVGFVGLLQADFQLMQGLHAIASFESVHRGNGVRGPSIGGWAAVAWYPLPHVEVRLDGILRRETAPAGVNPTTDFTLLWQFHFFL